MVSSLRMNSKSGDLWLEITTLRLSGSAEVETLSII